MFALVPVTSGFPYKVSLSCSFTVLYRYGLLLIVHLQRMKLLSIPLLIVVTGQPVLRNLTHPDIHWLLTHWNLAGSFLWPPFMLARYILSGCNPCMVQPSLRNTELKGKADLYSDFCKRDGPFTLPMMNISIGMLNFHCYSDSGI